MYLAILLALAMQALIVPGLSGAAANRALANYRLMLAGQKQLSDFSGRERLELLELDRWLRSHEGIRQSETRQECMQRLASGKPTNLEAALLDLKCSQRPSEQ